MLPSIVLTMSLIFGVSVFARVALMASRHPRPRAGEDPGHTVSAARQRNSAGRSCLTCNGVGFISRMQESMQPRSETLPEFYTDAHGRPATRVVTRSRMVGVMQSVRIPCASCGGTGRSRS